MIDDNFSAQSRARNEARFPVLKDVETYPGLECLPLMTDDEFRRLIWSIKKSGLIDPIVMVDGVIIDGRCRYIACRAAGVEPRFKEFEYKGKRKLSKDEEIEAYIFSANFLRVSLNTSQRCVIDALTEADCPGFYPEGWVSDEARLVAKYPSLAKGVTHTGMSLAEAYARAVECEREAEQRAEEHQRLETLRLAAPFVAILVDEGSITLDEGLARAEEIAAEPLVAEHVQVIKTLGRRMMTDALEIGRRLAECRRHIRSDWAGWLERELGFNYRSALNFIRIHELAAGRSENFSDMRLPVSGLYLLARPGTPEAVRDDIIARAAAGEEIGMAEIERALGGDRPPADPIVGLARHAAQLAEKRPDDPDVKQLVELLARMARAAGWRP